MPPAAPAAPPRRCLPLLALAMALLAGALLMPGAQVRAENPTPWPGTVVLPSPHSYATLVQRLEEAVRRNGMGIVARASATLGARSLGITIPGNMVVMVFHPRFAVRMLKAYVPAGFEAPIRYYITENPDGTATLTYRTPSSLFGPYESRALDEMAKELDVIFDRIAREAVAR